MGRLSEHQSAESKRIAVRQTHMAQLDEIRVATAGRAKRHANLPVLPYGLRLKRPPATALPAHKRGQQQEQEHLLFNLTALADKPGSAAPPHGRLLSPQSVPRPHLLSRGGGGGGGGVSMGSTPAARNKHSGSDMFEFLRKPSGERKGGGGVGGLLQLRDMARRKESGMSALSSKRG